MLELLSVVALACLSTTAVAQSQPSFQIAQGQATVTGRITGPPGGTQFPNRVPQNQTYFVQIDGRTSFAKFAAGAALPGGLDCIEVNCPASFPAGTTCWRCVEQIKAPE